MSELFDEFEKELKEFVPAEPPFRLMVALVDRLEPERSAAWRMGLRWIAVALTAAAVLAIAAGFWVGRQAGSLEAARAKTPASAVPAHASGFVPVVSEKYLYSAHDEGIVALSNGQTARKYSLHFLDTVTWRNENAGATVQMAVPRDEVRLVPVSTY